MITTSCAAATKDLKPSISLKDSNFICQISPCSDVQYKDYIGPIKKIERRYINEQFKFDYSQQIGIYVYEIFPMTQYPFFCLPGQQEPDSNFCPVYSEKSISIFYCKDTTIHIQFAFLQYIRTKIKPPLYKTYKLYSMQLNNKTKMWEEEKSPQVVVLMWDIRKQQYVIKK